jgi:histidinol phosphatase-like PHP family hydrolase
MHYNKGGSLIFVRSYAVSRSFGVASVVKPPRQHQNHFIDKRFLMKIDLHVHTSERSACARAGEVEQIRAAIASGLDGIAITDHDRLVPQERLAELRQQFAPFTIFTGIEVGAEDHHWLVLGIHEPALERLDWRYADLHRFVQSRGGYIILAHPFRYRPNIPVDLDSNPPDGIEWSSTNTPVNRESDIRALAARLGLTLFSNSDSHRPSSFGSYGTILPRRAGSDQELIEILRGLKPQAMPRNGKVHSSTG